MFKATSLTICCLLWAGLTQAAPAAGKEPTLSPLARAMGQAGVLHCQGRIHQVADFLAGQSLSGAVLLMPPDHLNDHLVSASLEIHDATTTFYANLNFAPMVAYGCDASYETIVYWPHNCDTIAKTQFSQAKNAGKLLDTILSMSYGDLQIFLMPAGPGCVSIKKQAIFDRF